MTAAEREEFEARPWNTTHSTSLYLEMGINQTRKAINAGELPGIRVGGQIRVPTARLLALLGE
ncbi:hypothetical protein SB754_03605 [Leifsonia sp. SIMBA_070]